MDKQSILFIGGDERQIFCAKHLFRCGYEVSIIGFEEYAHIPSELMVFNNLKIAIILADVIVLPTPFSINECIYAPYSAQQIKREDVLKFLESDKIVFGGKYDINFSESLKKKHIQHFDFLEQEEIVQKNAYLTAEGTVEKMMGYTPESLFEKKVLIVGFGRIAKHLIRLLQAFKVSVTVAARKKSDLTLAKLIGCKAKSIQQCQDLSGFDYIINTAPAVVFHSAALEQCKGIFLDLAGAAYHTQNYTKLSAIPGKYAPKSAGECNAQFIAETIGGAV